MRGRDYYDLKRRVQKKRWSRYLKSKQHRRIERMFRAMVSATKEAG